MQNDTISVIVPIYNAEPYLHKCVDSILAQTYTNLEIILIDDGSTDGSGAICDEYAQKNNNCTTIIKEGYKVIHKENGGVSSARNAGLDVAKGEYIAFVDADDFIPKDYFEILYSEMTDDVDMVTCEIYHYLPNREKSISSARVLRSDAVLDSSDPENLKSYINYTAFGVLYKRSVIGDLRFNTDYHYSEDSLFYFSALKNCKKVKHSKSTAYCYVINQDSSTHKPFSPKIYSQVYVWQDIYRLYADDARAKEIIMANYAWWCHYVLNKIRYADIKDIEMIDFLKHEIRRLLSQVLKFKNIGMFSTCFTKVGFILDSFCSEKLYRFVMMRYYFVCNRKLYEQIKGNTT